MSVSTAYCRALNAHLFSPLGILDNMLTPPSIGGYFPKIQILMAAFGANTGNFAYVEAAPSPYA